MQQKIIDVNSFSADETNIKKMNCTLMKLLFQYLKKKRVNHVFLFHLSIFSNKKQGGAFISNLTVGPYLGHVN